MSAIDPVTLTILAVNQLGPATFRTVALGRAVTIGSRRRDLRDLSCRALGDAEGAGDRPPHPHRDRIGVGAGRRRRCGVMGHLGRINRYRAIWISDVHLGTRGCKAEFLLDFLRWTESEYLYLVGDIVDGWRLRKSWYWPQSHNDVVQKLLRKARKGTKVIYIPGNHDEMAARLLPRCSSAA